MSVVTSEGGLTGLGYGLFGALMIALVIAAGVAGRAVPSGKRDGSRRALSTRQLVFCAMSMALAFVTSYIKVFTLPYGGSVTLCSMLFICLIGYWYGVRVGITTGLAYGILQFLQEPYVLSPFQVCCDYVFSFAALGLSGVFRNRKNGLFAGCLLGFLARGAFHTLGGYLYWMDYMPENFPKSLTAVYPIVYNYSYVLAEGVLILIVISLPPVKKALNQVQKSAVG